MPVFELGEPRVRLILRDPTPASFIAELAAGDLVVNTSVAHHRGDGLAQFFGDLNATWRGWEGSRTWHSLESQFMLGAEYQSTGHVQFRIAFAEVPGFRWEAFAYCHAENAMLAEYAKSAAAFGRALVAAT